LATTEAERLSAGHRGDPERGEAESQAHAAGHEAAHPNTRAWRRKRGLQITVAALAALVVVLVVYLIRDALAAFVFGGLLAFLINPLVDRLAAWIPRSLAILLVFTGLVAALAGLAAIFVPLLSTEAAQLQAQAPAMAAQAQTRIEQLQQGQPIVVLGLQLNLAQYAKGLDQRAGDFLLGQFGNALSISLAAVNALLQTLLMLIVAFLISLDAHRISGFIRHVVPPDYREDWDELWPRVKDMLRSYLRGQLTIAAIIGIGVWIALALEHVPFAFALGVLAGITSLVPFVGPWIGAVPIELVALSQGLGEAILVGVTYLVITNIVLQFLFPRIMGGAVRLPALVVIVAFLAGFSVAGILGMFVAIPVAATIAILFDYVYPRVYGAEAAA
jgi:predicted PurR-regulated permease PerM